MMFLLIRMQHTTLSLSFTHWSPKCLSSQASFLLHLTYLRLASKLHFNKSDKVDFSFWTFLFCVCLNWLSEAGDERGFGLVSFCSEEWWSLPCFFPLWSLSLWLPHYSRQLLRTLTNPALNFINYSVEEIKVKDGGNAFSGKCGIINVSTEG